MELLDIRQRLALVMAIAYLTASALKHEAADNDIEAALVLQRAVGDELDRQCERLEQIADRCGKGAT